MRVLYERLFPSLWTFLFCSAVFVFMYLRTCGEFKTAYTALYFMYYLAMYCTCQKWEGMDGERERERSRMFQTEKYQEVSQIKLGFDIKTGNMKAVVLNCA